MPKNIVYETPEIARFYAHHRVQWEALYPSEQWVFERIAAADGGSLGRVLDVGCAVGGLGRALAQRFTLSEYVGIDINRQAIDAARAAGLPAEVPHRYVAGDIVTAQDLHRGAFDTVASLGCADWNTDMTGILAACWAAVRPGGRFIVSLRLHPARSLLDMAESFQYVAFGDAIAGDEEIAPYSVLATRHALGLLSGLDPHPAQMLGRGYWGRPSATARTPLARVIFCVFAVEKPADPDGTDGGCLYTLSLPADAWADDGELGT